MNQVLSSDEVVEKILAKVGNKKEENEYTKEITSVFVAHRLTTIKNCDCIFVMEKGHIVEVGNHSELVERQDGVYRNLWNQQMR